jgi:nucleotide-binding universal stress UspA family protein
MYKKILIPLDGSTLAERILAHVQHIFPPDSTEIYLLRVVDLYRYRDIFRPDVLPELMPKVIDVDKWYEEARDYLRRVKGELRGAGYTVYTHVTAGEVSPTICEFADTQGVDLIAMTTHGYSSPARWLIGSVADRVVRGTELPVLLVRPSTEIPKPEELHRICVPLDGSELAEQALPYATELAKQKSAEILLIQAVLPVEELALYLPMGAPEFLSDVSTLELKKEAESYLTQVQARLQEQGITAQSMVVEGRPADAILDVVEAENVGLVIMSTHGRSGLGRWVFGSVADKVLHGVIHPLILVRGPAQRDNEIKTAEAEQGTSAAQ